MTHARMESMRMKILEKLASGSPEDDMSILRIREKARSCKRIYGAWAVKVYSNDQGGCAMKKW